MKETKLDYRKVDKATLIFRAITHKLRMRIVSLILSNKSMIVTDIYTELNLEQSLASQHLGILRRAKIVLTKRKGKFIHYYINDEMIEKISKSMDHLLPNR